MRSSINTVAIVRNGLSHEIPEPSLDPKIVPDRQANNLDDTSGKVVCYQCGAVIPSYYLMPEDQLGLGTCWDCAEPRGRWGRSR